MTTQTPYVGSEREPSNLLGAALTASDDDKLRARWISKEVAQHALLRRVGSTEGADIVGRPPKEDYSGILIPYVWPGDDHVREYRLRRDHPKVEITSTGRKETGKYLSPPGRGSMLYFVPGTDPALLDDPDVRIVFAEGEFKTLALYRLAWESAGDAADRPAFLPIGLSGVWNWRKHERRPAAEGGTEQVSVPIPDLGRLEWTGRLVTIVFDANVSKNQSVKDARYRFTRELQARGAEVAWFEWPKDLPAEINGIDDFLAAAGPDESLELLGRARRQRKSRATVVQMPSPGDDVRPVPADWRNDLIINAAGAPKPLLANALIALRQAPEWKDVLSFNEFSLEPMAKDAPVFGGFTGVLADTTDVLIAEWIQHEGISITPAAVRGAVNAVARQRSFHPVRDYLERVVWDRRARLDTWLQRYLGASANIDDGNIRDYLAAVGSRWLISAVARIFEPGCKVDHCLILENKQGERKSTAFRVLAGEYFTDEIADLGTKDAALQVAGVWIIELAELDSMSRGEVGRIKAFLTRATDRFRPPFGVRPIEVPRQCVFAGTVNESTYLRDCTGGRRFWPVRSGKIDIDGLKTDRDQLWAEAVVRYRNGEPWWLNTPELTAAAEHEQLARYDADPWQEPIATWLRSPNPRRDGDGRPVDSFNSDTDSVTIADILTHCLERPKAFWTQADQNRVARSLQALKWERFKKRVGTGSEWRYHQCSQ